MSMTEEEAADVMYDMATFTVVFTGAQLKILESALDSMLYEAAPQHLRNNGFALEPGEDGEIDEDDEEQVEYADLYPKVEEIESIINAAKHTARDLRSKGDGEVGVPKGQPRVADRNVPAPRAADDGNVRTRPRRKSSVRKPKRRK